MTKLVQELIDAALTLRESLNQMTFSSPADWVYNPLDYAWEPHLAYLTRFAKSTCEVLFLGMNPGPFGMAQTGVPFGEIASVRDWLKIEEPVGRPTNEHPKRKIEGFGCTKSEVSGRRLWGLFAAKFESPSVFFRNHFVTNYCPLVFMDEGARNITPDKLKRDDAIKLDALCDEHLHRVIHAIKPTHLVGVGAYAEACFRRVSGDHPQRKISKILHPSPASPAANKDWDGQVTKQLKDAGIWP
jgi:single-strand selective monofunctional uracil DNA glycosylase